MAYSISKIPLQNLTNTRDLGGFITNDGRRIKPCRLLRSGELFGASDADIEALVSRYNLKTIVDFRTDTECTQHPDPILPGVTHHRIPIFREETIGITREAKKAGDDQPEKEKTFMDDFLRLAADDSFDALKYMAGMYGSIVESAFSMKQYGRFFEILLQQEGGAVLWHCSAGKDRVGVGTALLLSALNVPRDLILEDYMMVNTFTAQATQALMEQMKCKVEDHGLVDKIKAILCVEESYIQSVFDHIDLKYGSMDVCLEQALGLTQEKRMQLGAMYLA